MRFTGRAIVAFLLVRAAVCEEAGRLLAEAQRRVHSATARYQGILRTVDQTGKTIEKGWILERIGPRGDSTIRIRFLSPVEVEGVEVLVLNRRNGPSGQWLWTPASGRVRRIMAAEIRVFGADFSFEDLEEPDMSQYAARLLGDTALDGMACWKIELRPKPGDRWLYSHAFVWLRKDNYAIVQVENYSGSSLMRRIVSRDIRNVQGIWTPHSVEVFQPERRTRTLFRLDKAEYNIPLDEAALSLPGPIPTGTAPGTGSAPCAYMVQPQSANAPAGGFTGMILVITQPGCTWSASASEDWITILAGSGKGATGAVSYRVAPNTTPRARTADLTVGGRAIPITQDAGS